MSPVRKKFDRVPESQRERMMTTQRTCACLNSQRSELPEYR